MGLNATVTPGLTVSETTVLTAANLNLLGTPTVSITGAIDASDIGANTVGSSELQDNAVEVRHIGSIGGTNFILSGDASGNGQGITTLAREGTETQISLLVNDKTTLGARYITGAIEATTSGDNKLNLAIAEDSISAAMLQDSALTRKVSIKDIQPGGGVSGRDGVASISSSALTGGLIVFDPDGQQADINGTNYWGKPKVLQATGAGQYLKSTGSQGKLEFGSLTEIPIAVASAYANPSKGQDDNVDSGSLSQIYAPNIHLIRHVGLTNFTKGVVRFFFSQGVVSVGDNVRVLGNAITNSYDNQCLPVVVASVAELQVDNDGNTDTSNGTVRQYVDVKFINAISPGTTTNPSETAAGNLRNPSYVNLTFYKS